MMFWRVKITLYSNTPIVLPLSYNHFLQSCIYNTLTPELSAFLHSKGFEAGGKVFKLFTFSKLFGKYKVVDKIISFIPPIYFYFSTSVNLIADTFSSEALKSKEIRIGKNSVFIEAVEFEPIRPKEEVVVKTISPITVHIPENGKLRYLSPDSERFFGLISSNLSKKFFANFGYSSEDISLVSLSSKWKKVVTFFKNTPVVGWEGMLLLKGDEKMVGLALSTGLGSKNSQGFGMIIEQEVEQGMVL